MNPFPGELPSQAAPCPFPWCTTDHGKTVHPDDETHRSAGVGFAARVRDGLVGGPGILTDVEVGILRRDDDEESWVSLEFGGGHGVAIDLGAARTLGRLLRDDPDLAAAFHDADGAGRRAGANHPHAHDQD
ncbi:MAG: RecA-superfamily ATPase [Microbacterium sp.]|nr:RecA-superfamily ATPase [Microbacterium sp.]